MIEPCRGYDAYLEREVDEYTRDYSNEVEECDMCSDDGFYVKGYNDANDFDVFFAFENFDFLNPKKFEIYKNYEVVECEECANSHHNKMHHYAIDLKNKLKNGII